MWGQDPQASLKNGLREQGMETGIFFLIVVKIWSQDKVSGV